MEPGIGEDSAILEKIPESKGNQKSQEKSRTIDRFRLEINPFPRLYLLNII